jgi:thiosulfate/3-mercaptopyruvate sulfurtransferase
MKFTKLSVLIFFCSTMSFAEKLAAQNPVNWTNKQLIEPAKLAETIKSNKNLPLIFSVGPAAPIPQSKNIGTMKDEGNIARLKEQLASLPKNSKIVVYCGCCPYEHCPNVRPAVQLLKDMKFTNFQLLDLPHNIKTDWIDKGYPVVQ